MNSASPLSLFFLCSITICLGAEQPVTLRPTKTIPLPGVNGRLDHFTLDVKQRRLFVAALGNNTAEVVDLSAGKHLRSIAGLHKPQGLLYLAELNQLGVANGADATFRLFDGASFRSSKTLDSLEDADNVRFDLRTKRIYIGYGEGALAIIDSAGMRQAGQIKLAGHPESFQLEEHGSRIYVNVPDAREVVVIDRDKRAVTATWPMQKFRANFPMALDEPNQRLFIGCRQPARLVVIDTRNGGPVADLAISGDTDDLFYDPALKRLYISCGEGFVDVIEQGDTDAYQLRERIATRAGARTSYFSAALNEFYLGLPRRGGEEAEIRVFQPQR